MRSRQGAFGAWRLAGLLMASVLAVAACGGATGGSGSGGAGAQSDSTQAGGLTELGKKLPQAIQDSKEIKVGSDIAYPPVEFDENGTAVGIDPDLAAEMGKKLGVKFTFSNSTFDNLIPALKSKRFDIIMSAMSATEERAKEISFVTYFTVGTSIVVKKGNPEGIQSLDDLCGKTVSVQDATTQEDVALEQQKKCEAQGKTLKVLTPKTDPEALLDIKSGRAVADMNDFPVAAYNAKTAGGGNDFEVVGEQIDAGPYGIGIRKEDTQLRDALLEAFKAIIADGTYQQVLEKWNVAKGAVTAPEVMGA
jgi:polar amino acid transport system substrate-binding protein